MSTQKQATATRRNTAKRVRAGANDARRVTVREQDPLSTRLGEIGLHQRAPVLVLVGGAGGMDETTMARLESLFVDAIVPVIELMGACVVDGGTDSGVMRLMGRARAKAGARFPLVGVMPEALVDETGDKAGDLSDKAQIEPNHTHMVLTPGNDWNDTPRWLAQVADVIAEGMPSLTLLINGGPIAWDDARASVDHGRMVIAVAGSGRTADSMVAALRGESDKPQAVQLVHSGMVEAVSLADGPAVLARVLAAHFSSRTAPQSNRADGGGYDDMRSKDLRALIDELDLPAVQKHFLRSRWLDQVSWMNSKSVKLKRSYYWLRVVSVVGGVAIPTLVALERTYTNWHLAPLVILVSLMVALSVAIEELFHFGERWIHYRRTSETLMREGWNFFQLSGSYQRFASLSDAYTEFATNVELLIEQDVDLYIKEIMRDTGKEKTSPSPGAGQSASQPPAATPPE